MQDAEMLYAGFPFSFPFHFSVAQCLLYC